MQKSVQLTVVLIGAAIFNILFWGEKQGLNVLLFDLFTLFILLKFSRESFQQRSVKALTVGTLISALLIILHNSLIVKIIHMLSLFTLIGMVQCSELRFLGYACLMYLSNCFAVPRSFVKSLQDLLLLRGSKKAAEQFQNMRLSLIIVPVFFLIYFIANPKFADLSEHVFNKFISWFTFSFNINHIMFFIMGLFIVGGIIWQQTTIHFKNFDSNKSFHLFKTAAVSDQKSDKSAFNLMITLNILLFINNFLDVKYIWIANNTVQSAAELIQFVHQGTSLLILAITLGIGVIFWIFKSELNFLENAPTLKKLRLIAYLWLVQNAVLALSVAIRNLRYIDHYGLAYKRIGVFIFLLLVMVGLALLYVKIKEKRTFFYFITQGSWAIYAVLLLSCFVNWDIFITKYNLTTTTKSGVIDGHFLIYGLSYKNLETLMEHKNDLIKKMPNTPIDSQQERGEVGDFFAENEQKARYIDQKLREKRANFEIEQKDLSILSWNYPDYRTTLFLRNSPR